MVSMGRRCLVCRTSSCIVESVVVVVRIVGSVCLLQPAGDVHDGARGGAHSLLSPFFFIIPTHKTTPTQHKETTFHRQKSNKVELGQKRRKKKKKKGG